jgi:hypothetical protein
MKEISVILKNNILITVQEFKILDHYACFGRLWTLIHKPTLTEPFITKQRAIEYIFDIESLIIFKIVSQNVLAVWDTDITKYFGPDDEFHLKDSLFIRPLINKHH